MRLTRCALAALLPAALAATQTHHARQDTVHVFPTGPPSSSAPSETWYTPTRPATTLPTAATVPLAPSMGLVLPAAHPYKHIYIGGHQLGWVEVAPASPPLAGGWMRQVAPAVVLPDYSVEMLNVTGSADPRDPYYNRFGPMCGSFVVSEDINTYEYMFKQTGWHMLVVNQTWMRPTITNNTCDLPLIDTQSFFASALFSVAPLPSAPTPSPRPMYAHTTWVRVATELPGALPAPPATWGLREQVIVGVSAALGGGGALAGVTVMLWLKRRRYLKAEKQAFEGMKPDERDEYLAGNPRSVLNPDPPPRAIVLWVRGLHVDIAAERARRAEAKAEKASRPRPHPPQFPGVQWAPHAGYAYPGQRHQWHPAPFSQPHPYSTSPFRGATYAHPPHLYNSYGPHPHGPQAQSDWRRMRDRQASRPRSSYL